MRIHASLLLTLLCAGCRYWSVRPERYDVVTVDATMDVVAIDAADEDTTAPPPIEASVDVQSDGPFVDPCPADRALLADGVGRFDPRGLLFSPVITHSDRACPLLVTASGRAFAAFAREADGRAVLLSHDGALTTLPAYGDFAPLLRNAIRWLAPGRSLATVRVGLDPDGSFGALTTFLIREGITSRTVRPEDLSTTSTDVWITLSTTTTTSATGREAVRAFVRSGGGLLYAGQSWNWQRTHAEHAANYPGNALMPSLGMFAAPAQISAADTAVGGALAPSPLSHATRAMERLGTAPIVVGAEQSLVTAVLSDAVEHLPIDDGFFTAVRRALDTSTAPVPTRDSPVRPATQPLYALLIRMLDRVARDGPIAWIRPSIAGSDFPGALSSAAVATVTARVSLAATALDARHYFADATAPQWRSTGVYAPPGATITATIDGAFTSRSLTLSIGAHDRALWDEAEWTRSPQLLRRAPMNAVRTQSASPYGGLVYVLVPPSAGAESIDVRIEGGVPSPTFYRGENAAEWIAAVRTTEAPWVELHGERLILTVPTVSARAVPDPEALMAFWDDVVRAMDDLSGFSAVRKERVVLDRQLPDGNSGVSGYPSARLQDRVTYTLDLNTLRAEGDWGTCFVLGRAHQLREYNFGPTSTATANLFTLFAMERVIGRPIANAPNPTLTAAARGARVEMYVTNGRNYSRDWADFTALETYLQLVEGFGWPALRALFHEYRDLPLSARPTSEDARTQQWVQRSARTFGRDLAPFYDRWAVPVSASTRTVTAMQPAWTAQPSRP